MRYSVKLPALDEGVTVASIVEWSVEAGQHVEAGDPLAVMGLDKVDADIPAPVSGTLIEMKAQPGDDVSVGDVIAIIEADADA